MNFPDPTRILLFSANEYISLYVARALDEGKYTVYFLGPMGQATRFSRFCKKYFTCEHTDAALTRQINSLSKHYGFSAVIPLDLSATVCMARMRSGLTCPVFSVRSVDDLMLLANKWRIVSLLKTLAVRHPTTVLVKTPQELSDTILPKPFLIKPLMQGGGKGIQKITGSRDIKNYIASFSPYKTFPLIVQEYIVGNDVDLSIVAKNGVIQGSTIQRWREGGDLEFIDDPEAYSIGQKIVRHLHYSGFMHFDMRRDAKTGKLFFLECNPRAWGSIGASIGAGVDFIELVLRCVQNTPVLRVGKPDSTYMAPVRLLVRTLTDPRYFYHTSYASRHDFIGMFTDPLPYLILFVKLCMERIALRFTYTGWARKWLVDRERSAFLSPITNDHAPRDGAGRLMPV